MGVGPAPRGRRGRAVSRRDVGLLITGRVTAPAPTAGRLCCYPPRRTSRKGSGRDGSGVGFVTRPNVVRQAKAVLTHCRGHLF